MPAFTRKYTIEQRDAVAMAYVDRGIAPMGRVLDLAASGELAPDLEPFEVGERTARDWARDLRRRRAGKIASQKIKDLKPADAIDAIALRLIASADQAMTVQERAKPGKRDWEQDRQIMRALREAKALINQPRGARPGARNPETGDMDQGGETRGGLAGSILAAARGTGNRSETTPPQQDATRDVDARASGVVQTTDGKQSSMGARGAGERASNGALRTSAA